MVIMIILIMDCFYILNSQKQGEGGWRKDFFCLCIGVYVFLCMCVHSGITWGCVIILIFTLTSLVKRQVTSFYCS